ncbi:TniQ family protein [Kitasatospora sp. NPDC006697]|uniref:TniQ family protein n=1 Tax=Kitasatospora sp. NPDC006697 TaxID=3364020 RepID=UPI003690F36F
MSDEQLQMMHRRTGLRPAQVRRMLYSHYAPTAFPSLLQPAHKVWQASEPWARREHSTACPLRLRASQGRWLLSWRLKWTFLCPDALVYLVNRCPRCGMQLYWRPSATNAQQRTFCTQPLNPPRTGPWPRGLPRCGFPMEELPVVPVEDEEAVHVQRRIDGLLAPADDASNIRAREALRDLDALVRVIGVVGSRAHADGMEDAVSRALLDGRSRAHRAGYAWMFSRGEPLAISVMVRIAARVLRVEDCVAGAAWFRERAEGFQLRPLSDARLAARDYPRLAALFPEEPLPSRKANRQRDQAV